MTQSINDKKYYQTMFYSKELNTKGDCLRSCLCTLLQIEPVSLPHSTCISDYIEILGDDYDFHGGFEFKDINEIKQFEGINGKFMCYGESERGCLHAVIIDNEGNLIHDPHSSNLGIKSIKGIWVIEPYKIIKC